MPFADEEIALMTDIPRVKKCYKLGIYETSVSDSGRGGGGGGGGVNRKQQRLKGAKGAGGGGGGGGVGGDTDLTGVNTIKPVVFEGKELEVAVVGAMALRGVT